MDKNVKTVSGDVDEDVPHNIDDIRRGSAIPLDQLPKSRWERSWPTIACGAGLFSDGYVRATSRRPLCMKINTGRFNL